MPRKDIPFLAERRIDSTISRASLPAPRTATLFSSGQRRSQYCVKADAVRNDSARHTKLIGANINTNDRERSAPNCREKKVITIAKVLTSAPDSATRTSPETNEGSG